MAVVESSRPDTIAHIKRVQNLLDETIAVLAGFRQQHDASGRALDQMIGDLTERQRVHDASKLAPPEIEYFDKFTPILKTLEYNSPAYKQCLAEMKPGLDHHYAVNDHHPQFFERGVHGMGLVQLVEMIIDWKAAGERHGGCLFRSIELNAERFGYGPELKNIFLNTARYLGLQPMPTEPDQIYLDGVLLATSNYLIINNSVRFTSSIKHGVVVRLVFNCFKIDHTFGPAPGVYGCLVYNHLLPEAVRLDYNKQDIATAT